MVEQRAIFLPDQEVILDFRIRYTQSSYIRAGGVGLPVTLLLVYRNAHRRKFCVFERFLAEHVVVDAC
jgi:hypothetical protein